eukprot:14214393-Alexandrium_andersonii.AAC.1
MRTTTRPRPPRRTATPRRRGTQAVKAAAQAAQVKQASRILSGPCAGASGRPQRQMYRLLHSTNK